jgi:hypothetical protein
MDAYINAARDWLLIDPWGITALTVVACALVTVVTLAFEYTVIAVIAAAVAVLRGRHGAPAAPSSDQAGLRASQSSV